MSLQVNFTTHGHDLKATYESILRPADPKTGNNWAMFGYDKGTNDLKVLGQGDGGLEELEDEFMDGKIQYAFARIIDPNTELNKFILIAWCGDGVPESKKGLFNSHLADVSNFLKGYHLQINARCEADVTPAQILKRVNEGSGSKYSIHKETYEQERIRPLQSAYKRTEIPDIAAMQRNPTKPEPAPKYGVAKTYGSTPSTPLPTTTTTSSPAVTRSWNPPVVNTPPPVSAVKPAVERTWKSSGASSYTVPGVTFNKIAPPSSLLNYSNNNTNNNNTSSSSPTPSTVPATRNDPTMNKAQQMRLEREAREKEERERIKREIEASEARDRQAQGQSNTFKEAEEKRFQDEQRQREQREQEERQRSQDRAREEREAREKEERARADAEDAARSAREEMKAREQAAQEEDQRRQKEQQQRQREKEEKEAADKRAKQQREEDERRRQEEEEEEERERAAQAAAAAVHATAQVAAASQVSHAGHEAAPDSVSAVVLYSYEQAEENEMSLIEGEIIVNVTELDVGWWSGESVDGARSGLFPANYVEVIENGQDHAAAAPAAAHYEEEHVADHHVDAPASNGHDHADTAAAASSGPSAVALYDYAAGEPNELSFAEGDVITDIEAVTDDWWSGTSNGASGLFPSNYVEMLQ
ncbi:hypothetical protein BGZ90_009881 [Linnemannia elongata]|nr:hypothetical protein BGZ90_009881 [Linnemannia elongata]